MRLPVRNSTLEGISVATGAPPPRTPVAMETRVPPVSEGTKESFFKFLHFYSVKKCFFFLSSSNEAFSKEKNVFFFFGGRGGIKRGKKQKNLLFSEHVKEWNLF